MSAEILQILIADDHQLFRDGIRTLLLAAPDMQLAGEAETGNEVVNLAAQLQPDVVLMDLRMPNMDGLTAIEKMHKDQPEIAVVILTTFNEDELMFRGLQAGARGYLLKDTDRATLFDTIRAAARGETLLQPDIMARVLSRVDNSPKTAGSGESINLTEREQEVLEAVARGERSKEVAAHLGISERTVKAHLASIYNKLGVDSRAAAIAVASQKGLLVIHQS